MKYYFTNKIKMEKLIDNKAIRAIFIYWVFISFAMLSMFFCCFIFFSFMKNYSYLFLVITRFCSYIYGQFCKLHKCTT